MTNETKPGEAYGFFSCPLDAAETQTLVRNVMEEPMGTKGLEIILNQGVNPADYPDFPRVEGVEGENPRELAQTAKSLGCNYSLKGTLPGASNEHTAAVMGYIFGGIYTSLVNDKVIPDGEFQGGIFYEEEGRYQIQE